MIRSLIIMVKEKVLYEELKPYEFRRRLQEAPIAYLPLGTIEWHGEHMPLGADGIQSQYLFELIAAEVGGIVLPKLFLGPDFRKVKDGKELYGMDIFQFEGRVYEEQQLEGSAYYINDELYKSILDSIARQLSRAGFKILVAHGHGPSTSQFINCKEEFKEKYGLSCYCCHFSDLGDEGAKLGYQTDHAAMNETSIVMAINEELVDLKQISDQEDVLPKGVLGADPRFNADPEIGFNAIQYTKDRMISILKKELLKL
jgi:creatinine amidohydrolase